MFANALRNRNNAAVLIAYRAPWALGFLTGSALLQRLLRTPLFTVR